MSAEATLDSMERLDQDMAAKHMMGFWRWNEVIAPHPVTTVQAHLWRWNDVYQHLVRAADLVDSERAERRAALLTNPGLNGQYTTHTIHASLQHLKPHEHVSAHRHTFAALRFILRGRGGYTTVQGQRCEMEAGDLILTPQLTWHDHSNDGDDPVVWLDEHDLPPVMALQQFAQDSYGQFQQPVQTTSRGSVACSGWSNQSIGRTPLSCITAGETPSRRCCHWPRSRLPLIRLTGSCSSSATP